MDKNVEIARAALDTLVKTAGGCEDRDELHQKAVDIFGAKLCTNEGLIKNACMAFNSNKAVYKLSSAKDDTRGNDFVVLNPDQVYKDICKVASAREVQKVAGAVIHPTFTHSVPKAQTSLKKAASGISSNPADFIEIDPSVRNMGLTIYNALKSAAGVVHKIATGVDIARHSYCSAVDNTNRVIAGMPKSAAAEAGSIATTKYGSLLHDLQWGDQPLKKYASSPMMPEGGVYDQISDVAQKAFVHESRKNLLKVACAEFAQTANRLAGAYNLQKYSLRKQAGFVSTMAGTAVGNAAPGIFGLTSGEKDKLYNELMNTNVQNTLRELELKRNFFEVYDDDYISTFPIEQVQDAYNAAVQKLPEKLKKHPSSATQLIRSWVTKQLSHGGVTSAEDAEDVFKAAESMRNERIDVNPFSER